VAARSSAVEDFIGRRIKKGALSIRLGKGPVRTFGDGGEPVAEVHIDQSAILRMMAKPSSLTLGECYMDGTIRLASGDIFDLVALVARNSRFGPMKDTWFKRLGRAARQRNDAQMAQRNASHHYDLSVDLYRRFLDVDLQYSCAYFARPDMTLEEAQAAKRARIATKLLLRPGDRVLDIGCGWGGLASIWPAANRLIFWASPWPLSSRRRPRRAPRRRALATASVSRSRTIGRSRGRSSASSPSACWSMWVSPISTPTSARSPT